MSTKICKKCKQEKSIEEFHRDTKAKDGYCSYCKICRNAWSDRWRAANIDHVRAVRKKRTQTDKYKQEHKEYNRQWKYENYASVLLTSAKTRAKKENIEFDLELQDILIPKKCPVLGIDLIYPSKAMSDCLPSIDRIDPTLGYTRTNICIISLRANRIKNDATLNELEAIVDYIRKHFNKLKEETDVSTQNAISGS